MRWTPPDLTPSVRTRPAAGSRLPEPAWPADQVPRQRSAETWPGLEHPAQSPSPTPTTPNTPPLDGRGAYTSPDGSRWSWDGQQWRVMLGEPVQLKWWRSRVAIISGAVLLALLTAPGVLAVSHVLGGIVTPAERMVIRGTLQAAGSAQTLHHAESLAFAEDLPDLIGAGFQPTPHVTVTVVSATETTYCLAAGPTGAPPVLWLTQDGESAFPCW